MKRLLCLSTVAFFSTQSFAGFILPDLSRSKSTQNASPIAVGFSDRNAATAMYTHTKQVADVNDIKNSEDNTNAFSGSVFYSNPSLHFEFVADYEKDKTHFTDPLLSDSDTDLYDFFGALGIPFGESIKAGISFESKKNTTNYSSSKTEASDVSITPGVGIKILPNTAIGFGVSHNTNSQKSIDQFAVTTQFPDLVTNQFFAGVAYGVDQKIGENGLGIEAVVQYRPKYSASSGNYISNAGTETAVFVSGNYIIDRLDLSFNAAVSTGKNYSETTSTSSQVIILKPEVTISNPFYISPVLQYFHSKDKSLSGADANTNADLFGYGIGAGMRVAKYDLSANYVHQKVTSTGNFKDNIDAISGRFTFYY